MKSWHSLLLLIALAVISQVTRATMPGDTAQTLPSVPARHVSHKNATSNGDRNMDPRCAAYDSLRTTHTRCPLNPLTAAAGRHHRCGSHVDCPAQLVCCDSGCGRRCVCPPAPSAEQCRPACTGQTTCRWRVAVVRPRHNRRIQPSTRATRQLKAVCVPQQLWNRGLPMSTAKAINAARPQCSRSCAAHQRCLWSKHQLRTTGRLVGVCSNVDLDDLLSEAHQLDDCVDRQDDEDSPYAVFADDDLDQRVTYRPRPAVKQTHRTPASRQQQRVPSRTVPVDSGITAFRDPAGDAGVFNHRRRIPSTVQHALHRYDDDRYEEDDVFEWDDDHEDDDDDDHDDHDDDDDDDDHDYGYFVERVEASGVQPVYEYSYSWP